MRRRVLLLLLQLLWQVLLLSLQLPMRRLVLLRLAMLRQPSRPPSLRRPRLWQLGPRLPLLRLLVLRLLPPSGGRTRAGSAPPGRP